MPDAVAHVVVAVCVNFHGAGRVDCVGCSYQPSAVHWLPIRPRRLRSVGSIVIVRTPPSESVAGYPESYWWVCTCCQVPSVCVGPAGVPLLLRNPRHQEQVFQRGNRSEEG